MTTGALIDEIVTQWFGLDTSDGNNTNLEARILSALQEIADRVHSAPHDWDFKHVVGGSVSMTSTGVADLPENFGYMTKEDAVYVSGQQHEVRWMEPRTLLRELRMGSGTETYPSHFTVHGVNATTKRNTIYALRPPSSTIALLVDYVKQAPTLANQTSDGHNLDYFPADWHRDIFKAGAKKILGLDGGDGRTPELELWLKEALEEKAVGRIFGRGELQRMGQGGGNHSFRMW